jgi:hypothetical protein
VSRDIQACVEAKDCKSLLLGTAVPNCIAEAAASVAPTEAAHTFCDAYVDARSKCGGAISSASCLQATKLSSDGSLHAAEKCITKSCDQMVACVTSALGSSGGEQGAADGGTADARADSGDAGSDARTDGGDASRSDSGSKSDASTATCPGSAPSKAELDSSGGWKPPPAPMNVCTASDLQRFQSNSAGAASYNDLVVGLNPACAACVASKESDATWSFVVTDATGTEGFFNYGACYAVKSASASCGKAVQYSEFCINTSCSDCATAADTAACESSSSVQNACSATFAADIQTGCGSNQTTLQTYDQACGSATKALAVLCGGG